MNYKKVDSYQLAVVSRKKQETKIQGAESEQRH